MHIYKICTQACWEEAQRQGIFTGMPIDVRDGFIHFSTAEQQAETLQQYFTGQTNLVILTVEADALDDTLRWEPSSSGHRAGLFPHLYSPLPLHAVVEVTHLETVPA